MACSHWFYRTRRHFLRPPQINRVQEVSKHHLSTPRGVLYERAGRRIRTDDLLITNQLLYQLSYAGNNAAQCSAVTGLRQAHSPD